MSKPHTDADPESITWLQQMRDEPSEGGRGGGFLDYPGDTRHEGESSIRSSDASLTEKEAAARLNVDRPVSRQQLFDAGIDPAAVSFDARPKHNAKFGEGDWVSYGSGDNQIGRILDVVTGNVDWPAADDPVEASSGDPAYVVGRITKGIGLYDDSDLESISAPDTGLEQDSAESLADSEGDEDGDAEGSDKENAVPNAIYTIEDPDEFQTALDRFRMNLSIPGIDDPGIGWDSYPDSWRKSSKPNRLILLDAWFSMGPPPGTWRGCNLTMKKSIVSRRGRAKFCASMKDEVYGTTHWRGGWLE